MREPWAQGLHLRIDRIGAVLAGACTLHCLAMPLLFGLLPSLTLALYSHRDPAHGLAIALLHAARWEWLAATLASLAAIASTATGVPRHRRRVPLVCAAIGALLLGCALLLPGIATSPVWHACSAVAGGAFLTAAHVSNRRALARTGK